MITRLINFLNSSPVNFLAVDNIANWLQKFGYQEFDPKNKFDQGKPGNKFYVKKNDSAIFAFNIGNKTLDKTGFRMICAHADSPTFRIKPNPQINCEGGVVKINTEVYGGPILSTWFDRPLTIAGRVVVRTDDPMNPKTMLLHVKRPIMQIPNLAIHFNRQVNDGVKLSKQKDTIPIIGLITEELEQKNMIGKLIAEQLDIVIEDIIDFDLYLADAMPACTFGIHDEFLSSGRLDDLSMCVAAIEALTATDTTDYTKVVAIFDNEETGSQTKQGAASPFIASIIRRINIAQGGNEETFQQAVEQAFMVSADNAHAWHPNYSEKYDPTNHPLLGHGPVVKFNAAQKYASDAVSAAIFKEICRAAQVPCQTFVNHSDVAGGSTLGNILASSLPVKGVDMGAPILAMHSCRETASTYDHIFTAKAFAQFFS